MAHAAAAELGCEGRSTRCLKTAPPVVPPAGTVLVRHFGDRDYRVTVTNEGCMQARRASLLDCTGGDLAQGVLASRLIRDLLCDRRRRGSPAHSCEGLTAHRTCVVTGRSRIDRFNRLEHNIAIACLGRVLRELHERVVTGSIPLHCERGIQSA